MILLNLFHTGLLTPVLSIVFLGLAGWFFYQANQKHNEEYGYFSPMPPNQWHKLANKTPWTKINMFWGVWVVLLIYIIVLLFIAHDYKGI